MMLDQLQALFSFVLKRIRTQPGLTLALVLGLTVIVALPMSGVLYAEGAYGHLLQAEIERVARRTNRPPFTYQFVYDGQRPLQWQEVAQLHDYLDGTTAPLLGLSPLVRIGYVESGLFQIFPATVSSYGDGRFALDEMRFALTTGLAEWMEVVEGAWPQTADAGEPIEVLVSRAFANRVGLQVGEMLTAYDFRNGGAGNQSGTFALRVAGIWQPTVATGPAWLFRPASAFDDKLLVTEGSFAQQLSPLLADEVAGAIWYLVLDGSEVNTAVVLPLMARATAVENRVVALLPEVKILTSPKNALGQYTETVSELTNLLTIFNLPTLVLVLAFVLLVAGLSVGERRLQIAQLRSRGASAVQVVSFAALEGLLLSGVALLLGTGWAVALAWLMGRTRSFLDFSAENSLQLLVGAGAWRVGVTAVGLALLVQLLPVVQALRLSIITVRQEDIHPKRPLWQRLWLDVALLLVALYGVYVLRRQGGLGETADPWQNPLLLFTPALIIFAAALICLRLMPWLMRFLSAQLALTKSFVLLLTTRQLARNPHQYATPLLLLIFTVSFSVFTSSLARTMDLQLFDEMFYGVGADVALFDFGEGATGNTTFLPMAAYEDLPGVGAATRIGRYASSLQLGRELYEGSFVGIDRHQFGNVAYWRADFADQPLGELMNGLAQSSNSVLVPRSFLQAGGLAIGDMIQQQVVLGGVRLEVNSQIVAVFDYFPGWYPAEERLLVVGNLDYLFSLAGGKFPYAVWLRTGPGFEVGTFERALPGFSPRLAERAEPLGRIEQVQAQPERQGLFGLLSIGFVAAVFLTILGFFLYALFSYRRRFVALGTMAAFGLSTRQMMALVAWELAVLLLTGLVLGTAVGGLISREFVPYFLLGGAAVPPHLVEIAWPLLAQTYALFALLYVTAVTILTLSLHRMKLFQALKLGETV